MRSDAKRNYEHLLVTAREVIAEQGAEASLRDIARRADVGLATLYRHFPTRDALLETLLHENLQALIQRAEYLERTTAPGEALGAWFLEATNFVRIFNGVVDLMAKALADTTSALHESCTNLRSVGVGLLHGAQQAGVAHQDIDGEDLFALIGAAGWIGDQPAFTERAERLAAFIGGAILTKQENAG